MEIEESGSVLSEIVNVKVAVRVRPMSDEENISGSVECVRILPGSNQLVIGNDKSFTFDNIFDINSSQIEIFNNCVLNLIDSCFKGYNSTIFAYGQTGSGKTYTMGTNDSFKEMEESKVGIIPRVIREIFSRINNNSRNKYTVKIS